MNLDHTGSYTIELEPNAPKDCVPELSSVTTNGNIVTVLDGTAHQSMGGIQFYAENTPFSWGYQHLRYIKDADNNILWKNWDIED